MGARDIYDVAERANVSIATVSRVLNTPDKVRPATRERVLTAIDELEFVPKAEAVARSRKATGRIAVVAPFFTFPSFTERLRGVATSLTASPFELSVYVVDTAARRDAYLTSLAVTGRVDGLILLALPFGDTLARRLLWHKLQAVCVEYVRSPFSSVEIDDAAGGHLAAQYFLDRGYRRCAFIGDRDVPDYAIPTSDRRLDGYRAALNAAGVSLPDTYVALAPHGLETARRMAHQLLDLPEPPAAIFAASDTQAMGALKAARDRGVRVPDQVAILGFDDLDVAEYIGLTTIRQQLEESGRVAVELLLALLADPTRSRQRVQLPLEIVRRETA